MKKPLGFQLMNLDMLLRFFLNSIQDILQNPVIFRAPNIHFHFLLFITHLFLTSSKPSFSTPSIPSNSHSDLILITFLFMLHFKHKKFYSKKRNLYTTFILFFTPSPPHHPPPCPILV